MEPEFFEATKTVPFHKDDPVIINAYMEQPTAEVGANMKLHVVSVNVLFCCVNEDLKDISNNSPQKLTKLTLDVVGHQRFCAGGANKVDKVKSYGLELHAGFPIEPNNTYKTVSLQKH